MISVLKECEKFKLLFDETTEKPTSLPYSREQISIAPNEFVAAQVINTKLKYLHYNFLTLYKLCNFADFKIPKTKTFAFSGGNFNLYEQEYRRNFSTPNTFLNESKKAAMSYYRPDLFGYILFYATDKQLLATIIYNNYFKLITNTTNIDPLSGSIKFDNISDIKVNRNNNLFVVDNTYKNIYLYTISHIVDYEGIYRNLPFTKSAVGGAGPQEEPTRFNNINTFAVNNKFVVVEDNINRCIKILDVNLNWLNTVSLKTFFDVVGKFDAMAINEDSTVYGIKGKELYAFEITKKFDLNLINSYDISSYIRETEVIKDVYFSFEDKNVFYIFTSSSIKKSWITNPSKCIGEYDFEGELVWSSVFYQDENTDSIVLKTNSPTNDGLLLLGFNDFLNINTLLTNNDFQIYSLEDIEINKEEYTTNWSYQKAVKKIYSNIQSLLNEVKFRLIEDNVDVAVIIDRVYNQTFLSYQDKIEEPYNLNVGLNEIFQADVINRLFETILEFQNTILLYAINNRTTRVYYSPAPEAISKESLVYTYYGDESLIINPAPARLVPYQDFIPLAGISFTFGGAPYMSSESISIVEGIIN